MERHCKTCGKPESNHNVRHPFIAMEIGRPYPETTPLPSSVELLEALTKERAERREQLRRDLTTALNRNGAEQDSNTPDYILAEMLMTHLDAFNKATRDRRNWFRTDNKEGII